MTLSLSLRRAIRSLLRYPAITVLAVLALGLGIGLPTAMFSMVDAAILRGLPVSDPSRLMHLERRRAGASGEGIGAAPRDFIGWSEQQRSFAALAAFRTGTAALRDNATVDRWDVAWLTPNAFALLGVRATVGRAFDASDVGPGLQPPVVLSAHIWRDRFAGNDSIVGQTVSIDGLPHTVVGVMPQSFRFPYGQDLWLPMPVTAATVSDTLFPQFDVFGKLHPGVNRDAARAEFAVIAQRMAQTYPATNTGYEITVKPFAQRFMGEVATTTMYVMLGAVLLVLVVACSNVANLLLVRAIHRSRDVAISLALGATRQRIIGQILMEAAVLAAAGGVLGLGVAQAGIALLSRTLSGLMPFWAIPRLDASVLLFAFVLAVVAAILAGIVPAFRTTATELSKTLRDDSRGATGANAGRVMQGLIVVELALSMGLLVTTALLSQAARNAQNVALGFPSASLLTARVSLPESQTGEQRLQFFNALEQRLSNDQAFSNAGLITTIPGTHASWRRVAIDGEVYQNRDDLLPALYAAATPAFFATTQVAAVTGRLFGTEDVATSEPVMLVNARFVERYLQGAEPIGRRIRMGLDANAPVRTIVGVVPNLWMGAFDASPDRNPPGFYVPIAQAPPASVALVGATRSREPLQAAQAARAATFAINPDVPVHDVRTFAQVIEQGTWFYGMGAVIMGVCGFSALLLATMGVYGVIAFSVGRRKREFGVRMALGATFASIVQLVMRRGVTQVALGLTIGMLLAMVLAQGVSSLLFDVSPRNPVVFTGVAVVLASIAVIAMLVPALSAARTQPLEALRGE